MYIFRICTDIKQAINSSNLVHEDATTSIMFVSESSHVDKFCDGKNHNKYAPTKQNIMCDRKSVTEVILQHPDFVNR